jgi:DNA-binding MarR family transcriptional regulator
VDDKQMLGQAEAIAFLLPTIMRQIFSSADDPVCDLPLAQLRVCSILQNGPKPMSVLSRELGVSLSALTQIADRLESSNLVCRVAEENDRRIRCLQLTESGEELMRHRREFHVRRVLNAIRNIPASNREQIHAALKTLSESSVRMKKQEKAVS